MSVGTCLPLPPIGTRARFFYRFFALVFSFLTRAPPGPTPPIERAHKSALYRYAMLASPPCVCIVFPGDSGGPTIRHPLNEPAAAPSVRSLFSQSPPLDDRAQIASSASREREDACVWMGGRGKGRWGREPKSQFSSSTSTARTLYRVVRGSQALYRNTQAP